MNERLSPQNHDPGSGDLAVVRFYGLPEESTKGMREWLGAPGSADPIDPENLVQAAKDTEAYLLSRPAGPEDEPSPDSHYEATLGQDDPARKTARKLIEEWAEADLADDQTRAADISEVLADRAMRRAALVKGSRTSDRLVDAAYAMDALYDRKERIKRQRLGTEESDGDKRNIVVRGFQRPPAKADEREDEGAPKPKPPPAAIALPVPPPRPAAPEPSPEAPPDQEAESSAKPPRRIGNPLRYAGAAIATWLSDPEKGKRRQVLVTLGGFLVAGAAAWLLGHQWHEHTHQAPPDMALPPPETPPPPHTDCTQHCLDNQPSGYKGQQYEWNAAADNYGAANATPRVLHMIDAARAHDGVQVHTWGDPASGHWGINDITVNSHNGGQRTYYDTPHKWAILEHLSRLRRLTDDDEDELLDQP